MFLVKNAVFYIQMFTKVINNSSSFLKENIMKSIYNIKYPRQKLAFYKLLKNHSMNPIFL